ncbi:MAG: hypothetical protein QOK22_975 [Gaiellaceae bacterium]|nr:hypothetical protein [Gaiellaceae bacterium]
MSTSEAQAPSAALRRAHDLAARARKLGHALERTSPARVLTPLVVVQLLAIVALALSVHHNGWIFYQGGDQLWYYTTSWLLLHGHMPYPLVGYGWPTVLSPIAAIAGPDYAEALPAITILQFAILVPAALLAMYGIGERLGGRLFGYWLAALWVAVPFIGIEYTNPGYHQRFTEVTLPQALGLTGMADFPSTAMLIVSAYFVLRAIQGGTRVDAVLAGLVGGFAIAIKPSSALYLGGVALAYLWTRHRRAAALFVAGLAPTLVMLAVWKWRGYGYLPLLQSGAGETVRLAAGVNASAPVGIAGLGKYVSLDWHHLHIQLLAIREHFWSARLVEWFAIAGVIGLARRSRPAALLFGGWFFAFVVVKGTFAQASIDDSSLLRLLMPAGPAFVVLLASLPLLLPRMPRRLHTTPPRPWGSRRLHRSLFACCGVVFFVAPLGLALAASPLKPTDTVSFVVSGNVPVPVDTSIDLHAQVQAGSVRLTWPKLSPLGGRYFYRVLRSKTGTPPDCSQFSATAANCIVNMDVVGTTRLAALDDKPGPGRWTYRVAPAANWLDDVTLGDAYLLSPPVDVTVR